MPRGRRLTKIDMEFISLVPEGANRRYFIAKAGGHFELAVPIRKVDAAKRQVTGRRVRHWRTGRTWRLQHRSRFRLDHARLHAQGARGLLASLATSSTTRFPPRTTSARSGRSARAIRCFPNDVGAWAVTRQIVVDKTWERVEKGELKAFQF